MTTGMTHIFSLDGDDRVYRSVSTTRRNEVSRSISTLELCSLESSVPAVRVDEYAVLLHEIGVERQQVTCRTKNTASKGQGTQAVLSV